MAKKRPCLGCGKLTEGSRCPSCQRDQDRIVSAKRKAWGQRRGGSLVTPAKAAAILKRDGHRCHICGQPIERAHHAAIDHVEPIAGRPLAEAKALGLLDDTNLAASHRWCNQRKGARRT